MLSTYLVIDILTVTLLLALSYVALSDGGYKLKLNRLFVVFSVIVAIWLPAIHIGNNLGVSENIALFANYIVFGASFAATILLAKIIVDIAELTTERTILNRIEWFLWVCALISATPLVGYGIEEQGRINGVVFGPLGGAYGAAIILLVMFIIFTVVKGLAIQKGLPRKRLKSIGYSLLIALPLVTLFSYILPTITGNFTFTEFGLTPALIVVVSLYYSVTKYSLFDIKLAAMRGLGYALTIGFMAIMYVILAYIFSIFFLKGNVTEGVSFSSVNIILALMLALIFQPIKRFFDRVTNGIFYRSDYDSEVFFREFGRILSFDTDLRLLLSQVISYISKNLKTESVFFYIVNRGVFGRKGTRKTRIPGADVDRLTEYYFKNHEAPEAIVLDRTEDKEIRKIMLSHQVQIILPLVLQDQAIGFLFIGDHKSRGYTMRDIKVLESVANELTIAVQNSLSVEEIRDLNESLQQKVDEATAELRSSNRQLQRLDEAKNDFISMASHQLRTPLTSIKGYLDMVLQGDLGRVSSTQRTVLSEAFLSSERMVSLINDFLNVSRLQTGKFNLEKRDSDLVAMVEEQVQMLGVVAKQHNQTLRAKLCKSVPHLNVDEDKVRQVVVNFIDNAIYYSPAGSKIDIELLCGDDEVIFRVVDRGIGVPKLEQPGLFTKFYRASNARKKRPDGTGVGLFLAKKVIATHGGKMIFESTEGEGSIFGFSLPMDTKHSKQKPSKPSGSGK